MPQWPHSYVLREDGHAREFDFVERLITKLGYEDAWGSRVDSYLVIGQFKYWVLGNVLNRAVAKVKRGSEETWARMAYPPREEDRAVRTGDRCQLGAGRGVGRDPEPPECMRGTGPPLCY